MVRLQVRDAGNLLTRAGLTIPSVDSDEIVVHYDSPDHLVSHIRSTLLPSTNENILNSTIHSQTTSTDRQTK